MRRFLAICLVTTVAFIASGCPITITCEDIGCPLGERCNTTSGECEVIETDCNEDPGVCRNGDVCDVETGECRPQRLQCTEQFTCPDAQTCNASTGFCEPAFRCETNSDCGVAERCDTSTQACVAAPCTSDSACPAAFVCDEDGLCEAGCRPDSSTCPDRQFCQVLGDDTIGRCVPNCAQDADCPFGQFCDLAAAPDSRCVDEGPCSVDTDCRIDEACTDGNCAQPPCASDADCLANQLCEVATGTCRSAACEEDNFGDPQPNHSLETAATLDLGTYTQLTICSGTSDWFALDARSADIVRIRLQQHEAEPDLDLYAYDAAGNPLVANEQLGMVSSLRFGAGRAQTIYVEVRPRGFVTSTYDLTLSSEPCRNDPFEENDSIIEATAVPGNPGVPTELALLACGFDEDWFRLNVTAPENGLRVERISGTPDLEVDLFTPDGLTVAVERDTAVRWPRVGTAGDYYVRAYGRLGQTGSYRLAFETLAPWSCPNAGFHNTEERAYLITPDDVVTETFCPADGAWEIDWITLDFDGAGLLELAVTPLGDAPPLDVALLRRVDEQTELVRTAVATDEEYRLVAAVDAAAGDWFARVSSPVPPRRIREASRYEVSFSLR